MTTPISLKPLRVGLLESPKQLECFPQLDLCDEFLVVRYSTGRSALRSVAAPHVWIVADALLDMSGLACMEMLAENQPEARFYLVADNFNSDDERRCLQIHGAKYLSRPMAEHWLPRLLKSQVRLAISQH